MAGDPRSDLVYRLNFGEIREQTHVHVPQKWIKIKAGTPDFGSQTRDFGSGIRIRQISVYDTRIIAHLPSHGRNPASNFMEVLICNAVSCRVLGSYNYRTPRFAGIESTFIMYFERGTSNLTPIVHIAQSVE